MTDLRLQDGMRMVATLPQPEAPDAVLLLTVSACRVIAGAGVAGYTAQAAQLVLELSQSLRSLFTLHTVGTVRSVTALKKVLKPRPDLERGKRSSAPEPLSVLQHSALLAAHPLSFWDWWSRTLPSVMPVAPAAVR